MYVNLKYIYDVSKEQEEREREYQKEYERLGITIDQKTIHEYPEMYLYFESEVELEAHIENMKPFIYDTCDGVITDVKIEYISKEDFLEWKTFLLRQAICKRYAKSIGLSLEETRESTKLFMDKDFLIQAYMYALDFLEDHEGNPFAHPDEVI